MGAPVVPLLVPDQALLWQKLVHELGGPWACIATGGLLLALALPLLRHARQARQEAQESKAATLLETLRSSPQAAVPNFFVYLRAFETTGKLRVPLFIRLRRASLEAMRGVTDDLESFVSAAVRSVGPLIALGRPGEGIGANRIETAEGAWQNDVDLLVRRSRGVLLVPSDRPGTLWEIQQLAAQGLLSKVIFVMPPRTAGDYDSAARWEDARRAVTQLGLELPPYDNNGLLFELESQGRLLQVEPLLPHARLTMRRAMLRLLDTDPPRRTLKQSMRSARWRARHASLFGWAETLRQLSPYVLAAAAPFAPPPGPEFDPADSWKLAFTRSAVTDTIGNAKMQQASLLPSDPFLWLRLGERESQGGEVASLARLGLGAVPDDVRARWFHGRLQMLARMSTERCAASALDQIGFHINLSYLHRDEIHAFVESETAAVIQGVQLIDQAAAPDYQTLSRALSDQLTALLGPHDSSVLTPSLHALTSRTPLDTASTCNLWRTIYAAALRDVTFAQTVAAFAWAATRSMDQTSR